MKAITFDMVQAIKDRKNFKKSNTSVEIFNGKAFVYLFGNNIAQISDTEIFISTCGWESKTTKERLNGILHAFGLGKISQESVYLPTPQKTGTMTQQQSFINYQIYNL
jgi:hypothetical protein